jgi:putative spermidine/putrescine transport system ATP-binding protein
VSFLTLENVRKRFQSNIAVETFSIAINRGEFVSLLGPSGCGKTTVLRMVAGFEQPDDGRILMDGADVSRSRPSARNIGMVFQSYALFPNMTVRDNVAFGLKIKGVAKPERDAQVLHMLELVGLPQLVDRYPHQLSGGQQQRVALARALAPHPAVLLLDEPLSALDAKIRVSLRQDIRNIQKQLGITTLFVTHDQDEALIMSDRVVVMNAGKIEQASAPELIYTAPATPFVAKFVGSLNVLEALAAPSKGKHHWFVGDKLLPLKPQASERAKLAFGLRPEALHLGQGAKGAIHLTGNVRALNFSGSTTRMHLEILNQVIEIDCFNRSGTSFPKPGEQATVHFYPDDAILFDV